MYQQQRKPVHQVVPPVVASQNETQAKEKLAGYVYEYLLHAGASKSAEMFKSEMLPQHNVSQINLGDSPGFLQDWWCVFWDLYSAAPERREKFEPSQEAKAFHEYGFIPTSAYPPGPPMMNGMHGGPPQFGNGAPGMVMPPGGIPDGMPGYFGQRGAQPGPSVQSNQASPIPGGNRYAHPGNRSGAPTPLTGMPPNFPGGVQPPPHFITEQMQRMQAAQAAAQQQQRLPPGSGRPGGIPSNYAPIRHSIRPYGPGGVPFLDSPSGTPPFQQQQNSMMMQNGGGMCSTNPLMSSPGPGPPGSVPQMGGPSNPDGAHDPRFMVQMPGASNFGMGHHEGSVGTPTSNPSSSQGNGLSMQQAPPDNNSSAPGGQLQNLLNGGDGGAMEMKQSPASHPANNGGTPSHNPGSIQAGGGPSSVAGHGPGSVHSQSGGGAPNSVSMAAPNSHQTPTSEPANMDFQGINPTGEDSASEISKIKASLINDFDQRPY